MRGGSRGVGVLLVAVAAWHLVALLDDEVALREAHLLERLPQLLAVQRSVGSEERGVRGGGGGGGDGGRGGGGGGGDGGGGGGGVSEVEMDGSLVLVET